MIECKLIIKPLKPKQDHSTGEWIEELSGLPIFPEGTKAEDAFKHHNKKGYWLTEEEFELLKVGTDSLNLLKLHEKQDAMIDLMLQSAKLVKEMVEEKTPSGHSDADIVAFQQGKNG